MSIVVTRHDTGLGPRTEVVRPLKTETNRKSQQLACDFFVLSYTHKRPWTKTASCVMEQASRMCYLLTEWRLCLGLRGLSVSIANMLALNHPTSGRLPEIRLRTGTCWTRLSCRLVCVWVCVCVCVWGRVVDVDLIVCVRQCVFGFTVVAFALCSSHEAFAP